VYFRCLETFDEHREASIIDAEIDLNANYRVPYPSDNEGDIAVKDYPRFTAGISSNLDDFVLTTPPPRSNAGLIRDLKNRGLNLSPPTTKVNDDGTVIVDGGRPLVILPTDEDSVPLVFNSFEDLAKAESVGELHPVLSVNLVIADGVLFDGQNPVRSIAELEMILTAVGTTEVGIGIINGGNRNRFNIKAEELVTFVKLFANLD
jgi:hypothetical protein